MSEKIYRIEWVDFFTGADCMDVVDETSARSCAKNDPLDEMRGVYEILDEEGNIGKNLLESFKSAIYNAPRPALQQEIIDMRAVDDAIEINELNGLCKLMSAYLFSKGTERKKLYNKVYHFGKVHGVTVLQLINWFTTDTY